MTRNQCKTVAPKARTRTLRTRLAIVAAGFGALGAFTVAKAEAAVPAVSVYNVHMSEGDAGSKLMPFSIKLSMASPAQEWVQLQPGTGGATPATAGKDFNSAGPYLVKFAPGETAKVVSVPIYGDTLDEYDETFVLNVVAHSPGITVANGQGVASITDDDAAPSVSISDVTKNEGTGGITPFTFTAKLSAPSGKLVKVSAVGQSGSALIPDDLTAGPATLSFPPGATAAGYTASVNGDAKPENTETFTVQLSNPVNVTIADGIGLGKIVDDDAVIADPQPPKPDPQPQPQPDPQPQPSGGSSSGVVVVHDSGGSTGQITGNTGANDAAGEGEQALSPSALVENRPAPESVDWTTSVMLALLGACVVGLIILTVMIAKRRTA